MAVSRIKVSLPAPVRDVRVCDGFEPLVSERKVRQALEEQFRTGFEAGQKELREQLLEQRKQLIELQNGVVRSLERALPGLIADCEKSLVLLALEAARRAVQQMPVDAARIEGVVKSALQELNESADYEVLLHPEDLALLVQVQSGILPKVESKVRFNADARLERGDCIVNTRHGSIAALREHIFEKLESAVLC